MIVLKNGVEELAKIFEDHKKCLLDFNTVWCGPCKMLAPELQKLEKLHPDWTVVSIDADKFQEIFSSTGSNAVPTMVIVIDGKPQDDIITGFRPVAMLEEIIKKY